MNIEKTMKKIVSIMAIVIIVIIITIALINFFKNKENINEVTGTEETSPDELEINNLVEECKVTNEYFVVKDILTQYYTYCKQLNTTEKDLVVYRMPLSEEEMKDYVKKEIEEKEHFAKETIYNMLDEKYINEFEISKENIEEKFKIDNKVKNVINKIYTIQNSLNVSTYFVTGILVDTANSKVSDFNVLVCLDMLNNTFSVCEKEYLEKYEYDKLNIGDALELNIESIEKNNYNTFEYKFIQDSEVCKEYFNNYRYNMLYNENYAYNMLDEEYKIKRFGSLENYKRYIEENYDSLSKCIVSKYQVAENKETKKYVCLDNFGNYYIFKQNNISNYNVQLDSYTIESEDFLNKYNNSDDKTKAGINAEKLFEALNRKDYTYIYNHLAESYKNNYFQSQDEFEDYIERNLFDYNGKEYKEYKQQGNVHIFKMKLLNKENENEQKDMTVMVQLNEGTDFVMSLSLEE